MTAGDHSWRGGTSNQLHYPPPGITILLDVSVGGLQTGIASQSLHISQRSANGRNLPRRNGNKHPPSRLQREIG